MKNLLEKLQKRFDEMCQTGKLFRSTVSGEQVWEAYFNAFPEKYNQILNTQREHDCNNCKSFMRHYGNIIAFDSNYQIMSMWDLEVDEEYSASVKAANDLLTSHPVGGFFVETFDFLYQAPYEKCTKQSETFKLGYSPNFVQYNGMPTAAVNADPNKIYEYDHLTVRIPNKFIYKGSESKGSIIGEKDSARGVFYRSLIEQNKETIELVVELIAQGSILNGSTYLHKVEKFLKHKTKFDQLSNSGKLIYSFVEIDDSARFNNELIGVLCKEIDTDGLEKAILAWNKRVDPANYKMATAPVTKSQIESAKKTVTELGYEESFIRRCATIDDILASEILHINEDKGVEKSVSIFDTISPSTSTKATLTKEAIEKLPETHIEDFMKEILPISKSIEVYVENSHKGNFATITTSSNKNSKRMFNWDNNFGLTFNGNLAGKSAIKEAVKGRGGNVTGELCIRLHFPNTTSDYDLHCRSSREHIYYGNCKGRRSHLSSGMLDLDAQGMDGNFPSEKRVENITFDEINNIPVNEEYTIFVENYAKRDSNYGFELEIENANTGEILKFNYNKFIDSKDRVQVLTFKRDSKGNLTITPLINVDDSSMSSMEIYGIETNQFHPVNLVCKSPNHWGNNKVGNLHYLFMIPGCKAPSKISTFHTDNLNSELTKHRKVIQMLSYSLRTESTEGQLSGIGFNPTMKDERLVVKAANKLYKLTFNK